MADVRRAVGLAVQTAQGTPATVPTWFRYVEKRDWNDNHEYDTAEYERFVRWMAGDAVPTTKHMTASLDLRVDPREFPLLLTAFGKYTYTATNTHTIDFAASGLKFLTVWFVNQAGEMWIASDAHGDKLTVTWDFTAGTIKATATLMGLTVTRATSSLPTISYPAYTNRDPFAAWQTPVLHDGTAFCLITGKLEIDNHLSLLYCSPTADPTGGTEPGLPPTEIQEGKASGTWDLTARQVGTTYTDTPYEDYATNQEAAYQIKSTDPATGYTMTWTLPRFKGVKGHFDSDPEKVNIRQEISGSLLLDDTTATGCKVVIVNGQTSY